jgi:hypothetical protein
MKPKPGDPIPKDPNSVEPWVMNWTAWLAGLLDTDGAVAGDTIADSAWTVHGPDSSLLVDADSIVTGSLKTQVQVSGGTVGEVYKVTNRITTSRGFIDDRSITFRVVEK